MNDYGMFERSGAIGHRCIKGVLASVGPDTQRGAILHVKVTKLHKLRGREIGTYRLLVLKFSGSLSGVISQIANV